VGWEGVGPSGLAVGDNVLQIAPAIAVSNLQLKVADRGDDLATAGIAGDDSRRTDSHRLVPGKLDNVG
jgi:hypothetical protein